MTQRRWMRRRARARRQWHGFAVDEFTVRNMALAMLEPVEGTTTPEIKAWDDAVHREFAA